MINARHMKRIAQSMTEIFVTDFQENPNYQGRNFSWQTFPENFAGLISSHIPTSCLRHEKDLSVFKKSEARIKRWIKNYARQLIKARGLNGEAV